MISPIIIDDRMLPGGNYPKEPLYKRILSFANMDSESAIYQLVNMYYNPSSIHRIVFTHRHTKGHWYRDDPAFYIIQAACIAVIALIYYILPITNYSLRTLFKLIFSFVGIDYVIIGLIVSTALWFYLNKWGKAPQTLHSTNQDVEWRYCVDVYCNGFVAIMVDINLGFLIITLIRHFSSSWFARIFLPNTVIAVGIINFIILAVPCLMILPYINKFGIAPFALPVLLIYIISLIFSINLGDIWVNVHL